MGQKTALSLVWACLSFTLASNCLAAPITVSARAISPEDYRVFGTGPANCELYLRVRIEPEAGSCEQPWEDDWEVCTDESGRFETEVDFCGTFSRDRPRILSARLSAGLSPGEVAWQVSTALNLPSQLPRSSLSRSNAHEWYQRQYRMDPMPVFSRTPPRILPPAR
jgi:hypothetical protein